MATDKSLTGSERVRKLQTMHHAKAKEDPKRRFHALCDKVWREDFLKEAWVQVRRNGGTAGVDGEGFKDIEAYGVEGWLGELARDLREGTYVPKAVRQVLIPKKQPGKFRPLGIPCIRDRVAQTAALLVLEPIVEADLQREQYALPSGAAQFPCDAAPGHPAGGYGMGPAEAESWRRCRSRPGAWVEEMNQAAGRLVRAGRPRSRVGFIPSRRRSKGGPSVFVSIRGPSSKTIGSFFLQ